jgi:hypothetical protein
MDGWLQYKKRHRGRRKKLAEAAVFRCLLLVLRVCWSFENRARARRRRRAGGAAGYV